MTRPPVDLSGVATDRTTCWPGVSGAAADSSASVRPVTVSVLPSIAFPSTSRLMTSAVPPAAWSSVATNRPDGFRSAMTGVFELIRSKSAISSATPASFAIASRCSTALVDPPVAETTAMAFSIERFVRMSRGRISLAASATAIPPMRCATAAFAGSVAGTLPLPRGEIPSASHTIAIVFAVNWPPHAPAPGQATSSSVRKSWSVILPAAWAPTASNTSCTVTGCPRNCPGAIDPP